MLPPLASADSISDLQIAFESSNALVASVAYTYDSENGDCIIMEGIPNDGGVGWTAWPVHSGSDFAFLNMRSISTIISSISI